MKAGPNLNGQVATEVMGWEKLVISTDPHKTDPWVWVMAGQATTPTVANPSWSPSTDMNDAMEVVGKMLRVCGNFGWHFSITTKMVYVSCVGDWKAGDVLQEKNLPEAICLAALKAMRGKIFK